MTKLTDAQLVVLSAACNRPDRLVLPLPKSLKGGAGIKVVTSLIAKGLIEEAEANVTRGDPVWRKNEEGRAMTLLATVDADALLNSGTEAAPIGPRRATRAKTAKAKAKSRRKPKAPPKAVTVAKRRDGTKQAQLIAMLERAKGATVTPAVPVTALLLASVAVMVWGPALTSVTAFVKTCTPLSLNVNV